MKTMINAKSFNGSPIKCKVELNVLKLSFSDRYSNEINPLSKQVCSQASFLLLDKLSKTFEDMQISDLSFVVVSKDLEQISLLRITPDADSLSFAIYEALLAFIATEIGYRNDMEETPLTYIEKNKAGFFSAFFEERKQEISNSSLIRAYELFRSRDYIEALNLTISVYAALDNAFDIQEADYLIFILKLKSQSINDEALNAEFQSKTEELKERPDLAKRYCFAYINYWEDKRDFSMPRKLIRRFTDQYPLSVLSPEERFTYHHLSGRAEYQRGDFLAALEQFSKAMSNLEPTNEESYAKILNSSVNCFTDNLFFEEAEALVNKAKEIRERSCFRKALKPLAALPASRQNPPNIKKLTIF